MACGSVEREAFAQRAEAAAGGGGDTAQILAAIQGLAARLDGTALELVQRKGQRLLQAVQQGTLVGYRLFKPNTRFGAARQT